MAGLVRPGKPSPRPSPMRRAPGEKPTSSSRKSSRKVTRRKGVNVPPPCYAKQGNCSAPDTLGMWLEEDTLTWWGETPSSQQFHAPRRLDRVSPHLLNGRVYLRSVVPSPLGEREGAKQGFVVGNSDLVRDGVGHAGF